MHFRFGEAILVRVRRELALRESGDKSPHSKWLPYFSKLTCKWP
jgi:hypothetical protein